MKKVENKCRKKRMGGVEFSPEVIVWKNIRYVWNTVIRWHKGVWINRTIIKHRSNVCVIQQPLSIILTEAKRVYKICGYKLERLKTDADVYRARLLARIVNDEVARGNIRKEK